MTDLTGWQRKHLRSLAHPLKPLVQIGKNGVTDELLMAIDKALIDHELIKIKFLAFKDERDQLSQKIASSTNSHVVGEIGNITILFRQNKDQAKRKIFLPVKN